VWMLLIAFICQGLVSCKVQFVPPFLVIKIFLTGAKPMFDPPTSLQKNHALLQLR